MSIKSVLEYIEKTFHFINSISSRGKELWFYKRSLTQPKKLLILMSKINPSSSCYLKFINTSTFGKFYQWKLNFSYLILKTTYQGLSKYWSLPLLFLLHSYSLLFWSKSFLHFYFTSFLTLVIFAMFAKPVNNTQKKESNLWNEQNCVFLFLWQRQSFKKGCLETRKGKCKDLRMSVFDIYKLLSDFLHSFFFIFISLLLKVYRILQ